MYSKEIRLLSNLKRFSLFSLDISCFHYNRFHTRYIHWKTNSESRIVASKNYIHACKYSAQNDTATFKKGEKINQNIWSKLNLNIRVTERVFIDDIKQALSQLRLENDVDSDKICLLLKCCGEYLPYIKTEARINLAKEIWDHVKNSNTTLNADLYSALLKCYLSNKYNVEPKEILGEMRENGVDSTEKIFQLLLEIACEHGLVGQAANIISKMKTYGFSANETVFSSLIIGYNKVRDEKNARGVLETMKSAKLTPGALTYVALLRGAAEKGDYSQLQNLLDTASSLQIQFTTSQLLSVVKSLALSNNEIFIPTIVKWIHPKLAAVQVHNMIIELVYLNCEEAAYKLLPLLPTEHVDDASTPVSFYIRAIIQADRPVHSLVKICKRLIKDERNCYALHKAAEYSFRSQNLKYCLPLIYEMKDFKPPLRPHYFWPLLKIMSKTEGESGVFEIIKEMLNLEVNFDEETILEYILPAISLEEPESALSRLREETKLNLSKIINPFVSHLLRLGDWNKAILIGSKYKSSLDGVSLRRPTIQCYLQTQNHVQLVNFIQLVPNFQIGLFFSTVLSSRRNEISDDMLVNILNELMKRKVTLSFAVKDMLQETLSSRGETFAHSVAMLDKLTVNTTKVEDLTTHSTLIPHPRDMSLEELECHLIELESKNSNTRGVLRRLLQAYNRHGNVEKGLEVATKLENNNCKFSVGMKATVLDLHLKNEDLENTLYYLDDIKKNHPQFRIDSYKIIDVAKLLLKNGYLQDCMKLLKEQTGDPKEINGVLRNCRELLNVAAELEGPQHTKEMFNLLLHHQYCDVSNIILGPVVLSYLRWNNVEGAVGEYKRCVKEYRKTPQQQELMSVLIRQFCEDDSTDTKKYEQMLDEVVEATNKVHGFQSTQVALAFAFAQVGNVKLLRKFLTDCKSKLNPAFVKQNCQRLLDEKDVSPLVCLVEAGKEQTSIDITTILPFILKIYRAKGDANGAISFWTKLQEMDVIPDQEFLSTLSTLIDGQKDDRGRTLT